MREGASHSRARWLPSLVWTIPLIAALLGVVLIARSVHSRGPTVTISFATAGGLERGKTRVKSKSVDIGTVRGIRLSHDLSHVLVTVELTKDAEKFAAKDTRFWVVAPRVGASGVSGLSALLNGPFIEADAGRSKALASDFVGLEAPPAVTIDEKGHRYRLHAETLGALDVGTSIFYRRDRVGQVIGYSIAKDGASVNIDVFVKAPFDQYVMTNTRWWRDSGVKVKVASNGVNIDMQSLASILSGGLAFEAPPDSPRQPQARDNTEFTLAANEAEATREPDGLPLRLMMYFDQSLRGLAVGAPVDFKGLVVGEVTNIGVHYDRRTRAFTMPVTMNLYPQRLRRLSSHGLPEMGTPEGKETMKAMVARGLRGQLRIANVLTGQLYVALSIFPEAKPAKANLDHDPIELPTVPGKLLALQSEAGDLAAKLDKMPLDEMGMNLNNSLKGADRKITHLSNEVLPPLSDNLDSVQQSLAGAGASLQQDSPFQVEVHQTLQGLMPTLQYFNAMSEYLQRHPESLLRGKAGDKP
ncbi:Intermembrane transport protein PqiB [Paraburkholderia caffeinitolerans]|uniref:Intermembrane transport protein PqiB n=1 Tax=Paraburkholderia caffeinitolerans TaxID=1723730 RepID=A0A6J5GLV8_9BURK|nr:Intermembrane transport protein PqiB [Paraburkholderia caffeinitolerans]